MKMLGIKFIFIFLISFFCLNSVAQLPFFPQFFNPYMFYPSIMQSAYPLPARSPFQLMCPPSMPLSLCLSRTSFSMVTYGDNSSVHPSMYTAVLKNLTPISKNRLNNMLSDDSWDTYRSSDGNYERITRKERRTIRENTDDYSLLHTDGERAVSEEKKDGRTKANIGKITAIQTEDVIGALGDNVADINGHSEPATEISGSKDIQISILRTLEEKGSCADLSDVQTEAMDQCTDCVSSGIVKKYKSNLSKKLKSKVCVGSVDSQFIEEVENNFKTTCFPFSDFKKYVKDTLICKACQSGIPPALMLSIMLLENSGKCRPAGDDGKSIGPFQIYQKMHEKRAKRICKKEKQLVLGMCLKNPKVGLDVSMDILTEYYKKLNKQKDPSFKCSKDSSLKEPYDDWRTTLASYNAGPGNLRDIKSQIGTPPVGVKEKKWKKLSEWEKMRLYYFKNCTTKKKKCLLGNLAYAEAGLGLATSRHPSIFKQWERHSSRLGIQNLNDNSHCEQVSSK